MSKAKNLATAVASEVIAVEVVDTPLNSDIPEEVVQTDLDARIASAIESATMETPKFVSRVCALTEMPERESEIVSKFPVRNY